MTKIFHHSSSSTVVSSQAVKKWVFTSALVVLWVLCILEWATGPQFPTQMTFDHFKYQIMLLVFGGALVAVAMKLRFMSTGVRYFLFAPLVLTVFNLMTLL